MYERKTEITRTPIFSPKQGQEVYQTIASNNEKFEGNVVIMGTYPSLEVARRCYGNDMNKFSKEGGGARHYAIRRVSVV